MSTTFLYEKRAHLIHPQSSLPATPIQTSITTLSQEVPTQFVLGPRAQGHHSYDRENNSMHYLENIGHDHHNS